jgi:glycosidase
MNIFDLKTIKLNAELSDITNYEPVSAVENIYTFDLSKNYNFEIETIDTNPKIIAFSNVPMEQKLLVAVNVGVKYTNSCAITFPVAVKWQNDIIPVFLVGKYYELLFISRDGGATWRGSCAGAWTL